MEIYVCLCKCTCLCVNVFGWVGWSWDGGGRVLLLGQPTMVGFDPWWKKCRFVIPARGYPARQNGGAGPRMRALISGRGYTAKKYILI